MAGYGVGVAATSVAGVPDSGVLVIASSPPGVVVPEGVWADIVGVPAEMVVGVADSLLFFLLLLQATPPAAIDTARSPVIVSAASLFIVVLPPQMTNRLLRRV
jgi:hypothetical protein